MVIIPCDPNSEAPEKVPCGTKEGYLLWVVGRQDMKYCRVTDIWGQIGGYAALTSCVVGEKYPKFYFSC